MARKRLFRAIAPRAAASLLAISFAMSATAYAQDSADDSDDADAKVIIVTAQKRSQNILDVPVAISAISQDTLQAAQIDRFTELTAVSPSLTITTSGNRNQNPIFLRGIGTFSFSTAAEPAVLVMIDDVPLLLPGQSIGNFADVARIEVLRGPQGTLFGKSASAGVISIVSQAPSKTLTGFVEASVTDDEEYRTQAAISGPIDANGGFRVSGFYNNFNGFLRNLQTGNMLGQEEAWGLRGRFDYTFGKVDVQLTADYSEFFDNGGDNTYRQVDRVRANGTPGNQQLNLTGITPGPTNRNVRINNEAVNDSKQLLLSSRISVDLDFATLTSITSLQNWKYLAQNDQDLQPTPDIFQDSTYDTTTVTQELRLTSPTDGDFDYIVGAYFADGETDRSFVRTATAPPLRQNWDSNAKIRNYAAFVQLGYDLSPKTLVSLGARVNRERIGVEFDDRRPGQQAIFRGADAETAFTGKLALQHFFDNGLMAFASIATGYKGQAYDISSGFNQRRADNPIRSESSVAYEIGLKGQAFDNMAQFQLIGFWTDYDDYQSQGINTELEVAQFELVNVGKLRTRGIELETTLNPAEGLTIFASGAYVDATIRQFPNSECYFGQTVEQGCVRNPASGLFSQDLAGAQLNNSPDFKFNLGFNFETPIASGVELVTNGNFTWQDDIFFDLRGNPRTRQGAYGLANASIGLQGDDKNWQVSLFVNNLFDQDYVTQIIDDTSTRVDPFIILQQIPRNASRFFGARVRLGF
ncbi:TonB-dependent receptor [Sphingobium algorifonticola]|nr:TonB-dependent receptor [Sphingobium algorifonticola]